ncbi:flagellar hook-basal body proteins [Desulfosporosinus orientis DSM 765]|uniref:Flagellar hook protein FlgE n=1 Tax=Desulfosporosinus orientis (strain ATCC 19365 / DSM 765 / NCIMB 8382 / VKM B-1628 / Singapore I) TaxID=768706 RepID=G7WHW9_DESOD|nr:flagellar hook-basal body complex protein [Desulfosporosinus orientis]AET70266.1 flagellar hook-basal body proteins [Desulfosporosinus orientis DSM 765]
MMRSLYSAISGLKNHQVKMDVIGNNIANVNTAGFKRSRVSFATQLSQTLKGASAPTGSQGGTNATQVGLGVRIGSIDQIMTQGSSQSTGKATDMMLQGSGFFVLNNNGQQVYTRAGGFGQDELGNLIDPASGAKVQGYSWGADDTTPVVWGAASDIRFKLGDVLATDSFYPIPEATASPLTINTALSANYMYSSSSLVGAQDLSIDGMTRVNGTPSSGQFSFDPIHGLITFASDCNPVATPLDVHFVAPSDTTGTSNSPAIVDAASTGTVIVAYPPKPGTIVYNNGTIPYSYTDSDTPGDGQYTVKALSGGNYQITFGANDVGIPAYTDSSGGTVAAVSPAATVATTSISYDFTNKAHTLEDFSIDQNGVITGIYSNGEDSVTHKIAQIAVATFANDAGLQNVGGNFYTTTNNSGLASIGAAGEDGRASIISNNLEMSNVDLSTEFTDMIVTQRGFQANSRVITVSDTMLEELINLKR